MKDLFSEHASTYAAYRPEYPRELFNFLFSGSPSFGRAWDVATGNGQVARYLARSFERVDATDISKEQLLEAGQEDRVHYQRMAAENTSFPNASFDLITVAQALHWFDIEGFHREVERVAKTGALLAEWGYGRMESEVDELDRIIGTLYQERVGPYWDPERAHIENAYEELPFPFSDAGRKNFRIEVEWSVERTVAYLRTWSSVQRYLQKEGADPVVPFAKELKERIGNGTIEWSFPVFLRYGFVTR